jgi:NTE family protein
MKPATAGLGLALGGGFARGFAHIGVLEVLEENHIPISCIAGTSVGSILGAAYASGLPVARIKEVCRGIRLKDFSRWRVSRMGLSSNDRMANLIRRCFGALTFEEMRIPLAVVTTDLGNGEPIVFTRGDVIEPIRASCAFPGLFEPVSIGEHCLADGGLVAPVPTRAAAALGARHVLGVDVGFNNWSSEAPTNIFQVISRSISIAQKHRNPSWERFADVMISPDVQEVEWDAFDRADQVIAAGRQAMREALPRLRELLHLTEFVPAQPSPAAA